jgi:transposase
MTEVYRAAPAAMGLVLDRWRAAASAAFTVLPRRWVVERATAWIGRNRRLSNDYAWLPASREAKLNLAMSRLMVRRLARPAACGVPILQRQGCRGLARAF